MSIEVTVGSGCNLSCGYCYEHPTRDAGNFGEAALVDFSAVTAALLAEGVGQRQAGDPQRLTGFSLHGGEPLLMPLADLDRLFAWGHELGVPLGVQTNGSLITDAHLALFERYGVHVGFSLDGPGRLNDSRWACSPEKTAITTQRSFRALAACQARRIPHSVIVTLHRLNAAPDVLPDLCAWFVELDAQGTRSVRLHTLELDHEAAAAWRLSVDDQVAALEAIGRLSLRHLTFDVFTDIERLLSGDDRQVTCVYNACDPLTTQAVRSIATNGDRLNCARTYKDGVPMAKASTAGHERQLALFYTPQEYGGCAGCRFWVVCKGHCPGEGLGGDWRNRSASCEVLQAMFTIGEERLIQRGVVPLTRHDARRHRVEAALLAAWPGRMVSISGSPDVAHGDSHGDGHGDLPHGDHTDAGGRA